jgi:putative ABC transport system permease protein
MLCDLRCALRWFRNSPVFIFAVTAILALGIGANTAVFSIVDAVLLRPLPYASARRLIRIEETSTKIPIAGIPATDYLRLRNRADLFSGIGAFQKDVVTITDTEEPVQAVALRCAGGIFQMLGSQAQLGRTLLDTDDPPNTTNITVLSDRLWRRLFHADPSVIGRKIVISDEAVTVAGVMPPGFEFPSSEYEMWMQLRLTPLSGLVHGVAMMKEGRSLGQVQSALAILGHQLEQEDPRKKTGLRFQVTPWRETPDLEYELTLVFILVAVALVLLIACANVGSLLLSRAVQRQREMAVRASLGATSWRILRQLFVESLIFTVLGSASGMLVAYGTLRLLLSKLAAIPVVLPHLQRVSLNGRVMLFNAVLCLLIAGLFSLAPVAFASKIDLQAVLRGSQGGSHSSAKLFSFLIAAETAFAFLLLAGSGLMIRSLIRLQEGDHGFHADHVLTLRVPLGTSTRPKSNKYDTKLRQMEFYRDILQRLERVPRVTSVAVVNNLPLSGFNTQTILPAPDGRPALLVTRTISPQYFRVMGIGLMHGRIFSDSDRIDAPRVAIVNESLARQLFPDRDPIGQTMPAEDPKAPLTTVVGVVRDGSQTTFQEPVKGELYLPYSQYLFGAFLSTVVVRTSGNPIALATILRQEVWTVDRNQPVTKIETMQDVIADSIWRPRFSVWVFSVLGGLALLLTSAGIYGIVAYTTALQAREVGIRLALGASPRRVVIEAFKFAMTPLLIGLLVSIAAALVLFRLLGSLIYEIGTNDPMTYIGASALVIMTGAIASLRPAMKAALADPLDTLRVD